MPKAEALARKIAANGPIRSEEEKNDSQIELPESACVKSGTDHLTFVKNDEPFALLEKFADRRETSFTPIGGNRVTRIVHQ